jgi:hypothetical protein
MPINKLKCKKCKKDYMHETITHKKSKSNVCPDCKQKSWKAYQKKYRAKRKAGK